MYNFGLGSNFEIPGWGKDSPGIFDSIKKDIIAEVRKAAREEIEPHIKRSYGLAIVSIMLSLIALIAAAA